MRLVTVTVLLSFVTAAPAVAQDEGVTIDPESPSAKEYAIPLEKERRQADPSQEGGDRIAQGSRSSPLFGEGIEPVQGRDSGGPTAGGAGKAENTDGTAASGGKSAEGGSDTQSDRGSSSRQPVPGSSAAEVLRATSNPGAPAGGADTMFIIGAVAAVVLAVGGGVGLLLRRRRRQS